MQFLNIGTYFDFCSQSINGMAIDSDSSHRMITIGYDDDDLECMNSMENNCTLYSFDEAIGYFSNNLIINITLPNVTLLSQVSLTNLENITIIGHNFPEVNCNYTGALMCKNCSNVTIKNIKWTRCGFFNISKTHYLTPISGLHFDNCRNLTIQCCKFVTSVVQLFQVSGDANIKNVQFSDDYTNMHPQPYYKYSYGGLYVDQSNFTNLTIHISDCLFANTKPNSAVVQLLIIKSENLGIKNVIIDSSSFIDCIDGQPSPINYGKSMIYVSISSDDATNVTFSNVRIQSNTVSDGNILSILSDSVVHLQSCTFLNNTAANLSLFQANNLRTDYLKFQHNIVKSALLLLTGQNIVASFHQLHILNTVLYGNGLVVLSDCNKITAYFANISVYFNTMLTDGSTFFYTCSDKNYTFSNAVNRLHIVNATVENNIGGGHGAGVYISSGYCTGSYTIERSTFNSIGNINSVVFYNSSNYSSDTTSLKVKKCIFANNSGTTFYLVNSHVLFLEGLTVFESNTGEHGGALYLDLNSTITFDAKSTVIFRENKALRYGGAIFCNVSTYNDCYKNFNNFIFYDQNSNVNFDNNVAIIGGNSIYLSISQSCDTMFKGHSSVTTHALSNQTITSPMELILLHPAESVNSTRIQQGDTEIPGILEYSTYFINNVMLGHDINILACVYDYNSKPVGPELFSLLITENKQNYSVNENKLNLIDCTLEGVKFQITGKHPSKNQIPTIVFQLHSIYDSAYEWKPIVVNLIVEISPCYSGFYYDVNSEKCICYTTDNIVSCSGSNAAIRKGYWFGFVDEQATTADCPVNYCRCEDTTSFCPLLPSLDHQCRENRMGTACGYCQNGYTLSFDSVDCISTNHCTAGYTVLIIMMSSLFWILVIISIFAMMHFKVGIGYLYSITFYYSVIDILLGQVLHTSYALYRTVAIVSGLAKLTPKFLGQLCFVKGLSGIDQHFIHYMHPLAVLLILLLISISTRFSPRLSLFVSRGVIHVICLLLLLSYTSIASTSLLLLKPISFTGLNKVYTYLSPDVEYFQGRHLVYALVAIVCGVAIVIGLPLLLFLEPFLNDKINFTRIKPLLDQFQGCYKDKYRYFAAYYMICRMVLLLIVNTNITNVFTVAYLQLITLVIITFIHVIVRPYVSKTLNAVDAFVLLTMILVVILQPFEVSNGFAPNTVIGLSFTLVVLPLLIFLALFTPFKSKQRIRQCIIDCAAAVRSMKKNEVRSKDIEMPNITQEYQVTVDQVLRNATATTIV